MWHSSSVEEIAKNLKTNINIGLTDDEAQKRFTTILQAAAICSTARM